MDKMNNNLTCDSNNYDGYSCYKENGFYIISGLKHSAVFESEPIVNTPMPIIPQECCSTNRRK